MKRWIFIFMALLSILGWETASLSPSLPDDTADGRGGAAADGDNDKKITTAIYGLLTVAVWQEFW